MGRVGSGRVGSTDPTPTLKKTNVPKYGEKKKVRCAIWYVAVEGGSLTA